MPIVEKKRITKVKKAQKLAEVPQTKDSAVMAMSKQSTILALQTLTSICEQGKNEAAKVAAAKELLTRGWGHAHTVPAGGDSPQNNQKITIVFPDEADAATSN